MKPLEPPHQHHLRAAEGWFELGNFDEAQGELSQIAVQFQQHPDVLELRWHLQAHPKRWEHCISLADALIAACPDRPSGWIHRSYALHELKRTKEAYESLRPIVDLFPMNAVMHYNLACYACQLGRIKEAKEWLKHAMLVGNVEEIKSMARNDPDLEPLHS